MKIEENKFIAYFKPIRLSETGRIVLPKEYREEQNLRAGSPLTALKIGNGLLLPRMKEFDAADNSIESTLIKNNLTAADFLDTLGETRKDLFKELYPEDGGRK